MEIFSRGAWIVIKEENFEITITDLNTVPEQLLIFAQSKLDEAKSRTVQEEEPVTEIPHLYTIAKWIREERDRLLKETDWTALPDIPFSRAKKEHWLAYRQMLRDLPQSLNLPSSDELDIHKYKEIQASFDGIKKKEDVLKLFPKLEVTQDESDKS